MWDSLFFFGELWVFQFCAAISMIVHGFTANQFMAECLKWRRCICAFMGYWISQLCSATKQNPLWNEKIGDLVRDILTCYDKKKPLGWLSLWLKWMFFWWILLNAWKGKGPSLTASVSIYLKSKKTMWTLSHWGVSYSSFYTASHCLSLWCSF